MSTFVRTIDPHESLGILGFLKMGHIIIKWPTYVFAIASHERGDVTFSKKLNINYNA